MLRIAEGMNSKGSRATAMLMAVAVVVPAAGGGVIPAAGDPARMMHVDGEPQVLPARTSVQPRLRADLTPSELDLFARLVTAEARGESYQGQVAVAAVVLNRMDSPLFPADLAGVIYQSRQFEPVDNGTISRPATDEARAAVMDALRGKDPSHGALFFFNPYKANSSFLWARPVTVWIGQHRFSR